MTCQWILTAVDESCSCVLSLAVAFIEWARHYDLHELEDILFNGGAARDHEPDSASKFVLHFREHQRIIKP